MKKTNDNTGSSLIALILDSYKEYVRFGYPKDPSIYFIRVNATTKTKLEMLKQYVIFNPKVKIPEDSFMGFKLVEDSRLADFIIEFGPETVFIDWK